MENTPKGTDPQPDGPIRFGDARPSVTPSEIVFKHLHKSGPLDIRMPESRGTLTLMSWGDRVENELSWRGWIGHEPKVMRWWARLVLDAKTVLNLDATVHAFEPVRRFAEGISVNCKFSGLDVKCFQQAVADEVGEVLIHDHCALHG
ncbi:hypothetical protein OS189_14285 [Sulfitobacter sp. F26169L]|nr:hypothetical protein [Sulfitobacter sp. F26169L]